MSGTKGQSDTVAKVPKFLGSILPSTARRTTDLAAIAMIVVIPLFLLGRTMLPGNVLSTAGLEHFHPWQNTSTPAELALPQMNLDSVRENLAYRVFLHRTLGRGQIPWWSPYMYGGIPFVALSHTEVLYPPVWLASQFGPYTTYGGLIAFHLLVAGIGMFLCLRAGGLSTLPGLIGSLVFMLNGMFVTRHGHPQFVATGAWLAWILLGVHCLLGTRAVLGMAVVAFATAMAILAGHPSVYVYGFYFMGGYMLCASFVFSSDVGWIKRALRVVGFSMAFAVGVGLASTQLLATMELASVSDRSERTLEELTRSLPHWSQLLRVVFPNAMGNPLDGNYWSVSRTSYTAGILYIGIIPLLLAVIGAIRGGRRGQVVAALAAAALCVMYIPPVYGFIHAVAPGFRFSRVDRLSIVIFLSAAFLAALGAQALQDRGTYAKAPRERWLTITAVIWAVAGLASAALTLWAMPHLSARSPDPAARSFDPSLLWAPVAWATLLWASTCLVLLAARTRPRSRWIVPVILILTIVDLTAFAWPFVLVRKSARMFRETPATRFLEEKVEPFRVAKFGRYGFRGQGVFPANTPSAFEIEDVHGFGPMHVRDLDVLMRAIDSEIEGSAWNVRPFHDLRSLDSPILDLLQVRYILSDRPIPTEGMRLAHRGDLFIYENEGVMPRAFFVRQWKVDPSLSSAASRLACGEVDPRRTVLLEHAPGLPPLNTSGRPRDNSVEFIFRDLTTVGLRKTGPESGFVVLSDPFYPGWRAWVDGTESQVFRANVMFRAVWVGEGDHEIVFEYRPTYLPIAIGITSFASVLLLLLVVLALRECRIVGPG